MTRSASPPPRWRPYRSQQQTAAPPRERPHPVLCPICDSQDWEDGFASDLAQGSYLRWFSGRLQMGMFGARKYGVPNSPMTGKRCRRCGMIYLFAPTPA